MKIYKLQNIKKINIFESNGNEQKVSYSLSLHAKLNGKKDEE